MKDITLNGTCPKCGGKKFEATLEVAPAVYRHCEVDKSRELILIEDDGMPDQPDLTVVCEKCGIEVSCEGYGFA